MSTVSLFGGATFPLGPFVPYENNPILRPKGDSWESSNLYNPAALVIDDQVVLLYRAHADDIVSHIGIDRKSTRLNSSHVAISYAVFCLKKKNERRDET